MPRKPKRRRPAPVASPGGGLSGPDEAGRGDCPGSVPPLSPQNHQNDQGGVKPSGSGLTGSVIPVMGCGGTRPKSHGKEVCLHLLDHPDRAKRFPDRSISGPPGAVNPGNQSQKVTKNGQAL